MSKRFFILCFGLLTLAGTSHAHDLEPLHVDGRYLKNPISRAIVFGGLEPFDQWNEVFNFIQKLRLQYGCPDPVIIYTGYNRDEVDGYVRFLMSMPNIIVKFGRFIPDQQPHFDEVLGVNLASDNQHAVQIS